MREYESGARTHRSLLTGEEDVETLVLNLYGIEYRWQINAIEAHQILNITEELFGPAK